MDPAPAFRNSSTKRSEFFNKLKPCCLEVVKTLRLIKNSGPDAVGKASALVAPTEQLYGVLVDQIAYDASVLDPNIADYAFFPLLSIFQHLDDYPARVIENATKCLRVLIQYGWKAAISKDNAQHFLVLLTSVVTGGVGPGSPSTSRPEWPEETVTEGYRALSALIRAAGTSPGTASAPGSPLVAANAIPALAHTVTVILGGITDSTIVAVQLEALGAIEALYTAVKDQEALATFLPGTVSGLVRAVASPGAQKTSKRVVVRTLEVLYTVLTQTIGDLQTRRLRMVRDHESTQEGSDASPEAEQNPSPVFKPRLDASWLRATTAQVKVALASVLKLRNHESEDVQDAVRQFCIGLLDECHASLEESTPILVESAIVTTKDEGDAAVTGGNAGFEDLASMQTGFHGLGPQTTLSDLAILYPELGDAVKTTAYNWATSLSRCMQASDEEVKQRAIRNLQKAIYVLETLHIDSTTLQNTLSTALRDSVVTLVVSSASPMVAVDEEDTDSSVIWKQDASAVQPQPYKPVLLSLGSQKGTRGALLDLLDRVGSSSQQTRLAAEMLDFVRDSDGLDQVSAFWLSFELVKASLAKLAETDSFLDFSSLDEGDGAEAVLEDLLTFSIGKLASHSDTTDEGDWRLDAVAMEVTAFAAARAKEAFRPELIDVLYPIATYLGSPEAQLRGHAIVTLNSLAVSCGYTSVSELIIDNVDYMLNSVSLRLNTFDISPASTKVLTMMIRLAGPRLVPFLDDVVAAIFAALDNYHGYPLFVESLFAVLGEVVQQSVKSDTLLLEDAPSTTGPTYNRKRRAEPLTTHDLLGILDQRAKRRRTDEEELLQSQEAAGHPKKPWKSEADALLRKQKEEPTEKDAEEAKGAEKELSKPEDPKTPTYALLARITTLTQHYLTSPTPTLRKALLELLATVSPALAADENAFLPLVNAVWPVVVTRLYDGEPYVVMAACSALGAICASAGDFVASRVKAEWQGGLGRWCTRAKGEAASKTGRAGGSTSTSTGKPTKMASLLQIRGKPSAGAGTVIHTTDVILPTRATASGGDAVPQQLQQLQQSSQLGSSTKETMVVGLGRFAQAVQIWEAVAGLLTDIVTYVRLDDDIYDQILDLLLEPAGSTRLLPPSLEQRACEALEVVNADAVWLARFKAGLLDTGAATRQPAWDGIRFASLGEQVGM